ncbi:uncharacterized protein TNCV_2489631 [Trichonephila clavipes]|nr:uncharacterized protein TNCV_2489631 [Trichonephila clavipes]
MSNKSPFAFHKALIGIGGEPKTVKRLRSGELLIETHSVIQTKSPHLPTSIKAGYLHCKIRPYVPNPLRCFKCQRFGHSETACRGQLTCSRCASVGHASTDCSLEPKCFNCSESHQSDSKLCFKWKLEKKIQEIKTSKNISYPEARKLILPQISQTYSQATKSSTTTTTTQTDDSIRKIVCPPLKLLQPFTAVLKPTMPFKIPTVTKLSASTEAQLLPTTSSAAATSSDSQPPVPFVITTSSASISFITSTTTMFTALSNKTHPSALETTTSNSIPSTIISPVSHASTQKSRRKKRNPKTICNVTAPTVKPKLEIKMAPHKPRKSSSIQDTDDEDMIVYDMAEQIESPKKNDKYFLSKEYWKNESWRQGGFLHVITPTRVRNSQ